MKSIKIRKAVIPAAGMGTRFLPATKAIPKEMLPIVNIPTIQYIVEEALKSGIEEIIIIVSASKNPIIDHFDSSYELEKRLLEKNKTSEYELIKKISESVNIHFIRQKEPKGLGHAISCAKTFVGDEPFAVLLGDDVVVTQPNKKTALQQCMEVYDTTKSSVIGVQKVARENISKYGIVNPTNKANLKNSYFKLCGVVEKPLPANAPSEYAILGRYILTPEIFDELEKTKIDKSGEIQLTDAIMSLTKSQQVYACNFVGQRYDIGSKSGFVIATIDMALKDKSINKEIKSHIQKIVKEDQEK